MSVNHSDPTDSDDEYITFKPLMVSCLMGIGQLQCAAESLGVQLGESTRRYLVLLLLKKMGPRHVQGLISNFVKKGLISWEDDLYEVDYILDHCHDDSNGEMYYFIKWEGWGSDHNSWEPASNLQCTDVIEKYMATAKQSSNRRGVKRKFKDIVKIPGPTSKSVLVDELIDKLSCSNKITKMSPMDIINLYSPAKKVKTLKPLIGGRASTHHSNLRPKFKRKILSKKKLKADVQQALQDWESELNEIAKDVDSAPIRVVNDVDLEGPPDTFVYINKCKAGPGVSIPTDPLIGCECEDCFSSKNECCASCSGAEFAYYKSGKIRLPPGRPVYECNNRCKCGPDCKNRVVQKGRRYKVCIFRTDNGRGWGVKALQAIKKGSFVMEYVGEVITHEEAERRGMEYDAAGRTYLFDLDFADNNIAFTVDAGVYGNAAHFINHSCDPNMEVYCVWVNNLDPGMPHICLFAKRDIEKDEELSFDYLCPRPSSDEEDSKSQDSASSLKQSATGPSGGLASVLSTPPSTPSEEAPAQPGVDGGLTSETGDNVAVGETGDSPRDKSSSKAPNSYSCICQCGAANCRVYLF